MVEASFGEKGGKIMELFILQDITKSFESSMVARSLGALFVGTILNPNFFH